MILLSTYVDMQRQYQAWATALGYDLKVVTTPGALSVGGQQYVLLVDLSDNSLLDRMTEATLNWANLHPWGHIICILNLDSGAGTGARVRVLADIVRVTKADCMLRHDGLEALTRIVRAHERREVSRGLEQQLAQRLQRIAAAPVVEHVLQVAPQHRWVHALGAPATLRGWAWRLERERQRGLKDLLKVMRLIWASYLRSQGWSHPAVSEYLHYGALERRRDGAFRALGKPFGLRAADVLDLRFEVLMHRAHDIILRPDTPSIPELTGVVHAAVVESRSHTAIVPYTVQSSTHP